MKNKIFLDALSKSNARWDGKQEFFLFGLSCDTFVENKKHRTASEMDVNDSNDLEKVCRDMYISILSFKQVESNYRYL